MSGHRQILMTLGQSRLNLLIIFIETEHYAKSPVARRLGC